MPGATVRTLPVSGVPVIVGSAVAAGASVGAAVTAGVIAEFAFATPAAFVAVTWTRNVRPMSVEPTT